MTQGWKRVATAPMALSWIHLCVAYENWSAVKFEGRDGEREANDLPPIGSFYVVVGADRGGSGK